MEHWPENTRIREAIKRLLEGAGVSRPPVNLDSLVKHIGRIEVQDAEMGQLLGSVERKGETFKIRVNASQPHRRRFTVAHELAHVLLMGARAANRPPVRLRVAEPKKYDEQETLCNFIAAEILMPYHLFRPRVIHMPVSIQTISRLSEEFETSVLATAIRFAHFAEQPMATVIWRQKGDRLTPRATPSRQGKELAARWEDRPLGDSSSGPVHAFRCNHTVVTWETKSLSGASDSSYCESQGFLSGAGRFVLSLVKTAVTPDAFKFTQRFAHRSCGVATGCNGTD